MNYQICSQILINKCNFVKFEKIMKRFMIYVLSPEEVRKADNKAINDYHIPATILMENAARSVAETFDTIIKNNKLPIERIAVFCGVGNNGGDGFALARHLVDYGKVDVVWIGEPSKMSYETKLNFDILAGLEINLNHIDSVEQLNSIDWNYDVIFDALIGVGGSENLKGIVVNILERINKIKCLKIAVDIPTGLNAETGNANQNTFRADYTVTMFAVKTGMLLGMGPDYCGKIIVGKLGAPQSIVGSLCRHYIFEKGDILANLPKRKRNSSKFDYGKVQIIAGSALMPGAACLVANSVIKSGAGLVYLFSPKVHSQLLPEVISAELANNSYGSIGFANIDSLLEFSQNMNVIAIGPGLQINNDTEKIVEEIVKNRDKNISIVLDADAITPKLLKSELDKNVLLTPHIGEFARMIEVPREEVATNPLVFAQLWASKLKCNILLKGATTIITNGEKTFLNPFGHPSLATAGSGDVLTGIIASLSAQGCELITAATLGAYIHSKIGEYYEQNYSSRGLTASKMIDLIEIIYHELEKQTKE